MAKSKSIVIFSVIFTIILVLSSSAFPLVLDDENARSSLKGLKGVYVWITFLPGPIEVLESRGFSEEVVKTDVELKLRLAGINAVSNTEAIYDIQGKATLVVEIHWVDTQISETNTQSKQIAYTCNAELFQSTYLARNPTLKVMAKTWSRDGIGVGYTDQDLAIHIRNHVKDLLDNFINAYLSVNPKGGK